jgi:hypothetical protein
VRKRRKSVDRSEAEKYLLVGQSLRRSAADLNALGEAAYGNALGILCIHAAIAFSDALSIWAKGMKSTGYHSDAAGLLVELFPQDSGTRGAIRSLRTLLSSKDSIEYSGRFYQLEEARNLFRHLQKFSVWAEKKYGTLA